MKTRNYVIVLICFILSVGSAYSQKLIPGFTAAGFTNDLNLKGFSPNTSDFDNVIGVEGGVYLQINTGALYIRPMAVASFSRSTVKSIVNESENESDFNLSNLEIPALVGLKFFNIMAIEAGPSYNYLISYSDEINSVQLDLNRHSLGYRAGARIMFSRLGIFGHYGGTIAELDNSDYKLNRPSRIIIGATLDLAGKK